MAAARQVLESRPPERRTTARGLGLEAGFRRGGMGWLLSHVRIAPGHYLDVVPVRRGAPGLGLGPGRGPGPGDSLVGGAREQVPRRARELAVAAGSLAAFERLGERAGEGGRR